MSRRNRWPFGTLRCLITDECLHVDFDDTITVLTTTRTPDVPSGNSFMIKTRTCITWARGNSCRVLVTTTVEWSGRSMLKGVITTASISGQKQYHDALEKEVRTYIQQHRSEFVEPGTDSAAADEAAAAAAGTTDGAADHEREFGLHTARMF